MNYNVALQNPNGLKRSNANSNLKRNFWRGYNAIPRTMCILFLLQRTSAFSSSSLFLCGFCFFQVSAISFFFRQRTSLLFAALVRSVSMVEDWVLAGSCSTLVLFLACVTIRTNFLKCFANFCHQCGQKLNLSKFSNKAASSVDRKKLIKKNFHGVLAFVLFSY